MTGLRRYDRIGPALAALDWPRIEKLIARRDAVNIHRAIYEPDAPVSLRAMFFATERSVRACHTCYGIGSVSVTSSEPPPVM